MRRIGLDFDNTLVCYDGLFHRAACDVGLIPANVARNKNAVRDYLRAQGREQDWIGLQGEVYGRRMLEAEPFADMLTFLLEAVHAGYALSIVSHKTRHPFVGERWDLHARAREWLEQHVMPGLIAPQDIHFELTKDAKLARIEACRCEAFVDDLPEILLADGFPKTTRAVLFDPAEHFSNDPRYVRVGSWIDAMEHFSIATGHAPVTAPDQTTLTTADLNSSAQGVHV